MNRNHALHQLHSSRSHQQIQAQIRHHFAAPRHLYPPHVHHYFRDLNKLLQASTATQQAWLAALATYKTINPTTLEKERKIRRRVLRSLGNQPILRPLRPAASPAFNRVLNQLRHYRQNPGHHTMAFSPQPSAPPHRCLKTPWCSYGASSLTSPPRPL